MVYLRDLQKFEDLDDQLVLDRFEKSILAPESSNFALYFDDSQAFGAVDIVNKDDLCKFLEAKIPMGQKSSQGSSNVTRWINFWTPSKQEESMDLLAKRYGFSARLVALMKTHPPPLKDKAVAKQKSSGNQAKAHKHKADDCEHQAAATKSNEKQEPATDQALVLNHYDIVREIWHFCSVDFGSKYVCVGYNSLYNTGGPNSSKQQVPDGNDSNKPAGTRAWTWLVLCEDYTVLTIHENLKKGPPPGKSLQPDDLAVIRRHIKHVLRRLSKPANPTRADNPIMTLTLRREINPGITESLQAVESSSLLFYYLFDDWYTSYSLVTRKDHQYGAKLENLREQMFDSAAELQQVKRLHHYGRQLSVLKKIYQSYDRIIQRILDHQDTVTKEETPEQQGSRAPPTTNVLGVPLHHSAITRFRALKDRINLFPLSEIDECLSEKDALVQVSFNLISLKEARLVDSLTRITILLAKATMLFLPVSLMTAYFTIPMSGGDAEYTARQYWIAFAVLVAVTYMILLLFGYLSDTQDTKTIYKSLTSIFFKKVKENLGRGMDQKLELEDE